MQLTDQWLDSPGAEAKFLHQNQSLPTLAQKPAACGHPFLPMSLATEQFRKIFLIACVDAMQGRKIVGHAVLHLIFGEVFGQGHLNRAIEWQIATMHFFERL